MAVLIAGAGIGGLTAALALVAAGVEVTVAEQAPVLAPVGAGLQLSPNAMRVLAGLGLSDEIAGVAVRPEAVHIRRGRDAAEIGRVPLGDAAEARYGAPFLVVHRADLQAVLQDAARRSPMVRLRTGTAVRQFTSGGSHVEVTLRSPDREVQERFSALVGADGLRSSVRAVLFPDAPKVPMFCGRTAWRSLVPAAAAPDFARRPASNLWLGHKAHLVHYPVRGGALINVVAIVEDAWRGDDAGFWAVPGDPAQLLARFSNWDRQARTLLAAAADWRIWPLFDRPPLAAWSTGPVALLGDAAHPMLPFLAQGAAQAVEDAAALADAVRRNRDGLPEAFRAYHRERRAKAARVQAESRRQATLYHLGGPAAAARDIVLRMVPPARMLSRYDWLYGPPMATQ